MTTAIVQPEVKRKKRIIPFGNRYLVKRKTIAEMSSGKESAIELPDDVKARLTEMATVIYIPSFSIVDDALLNNMALIVESLAEKAKQGDTEAIRGLREFNDSFLRTRLIRAGDTVMISKYSGIDFYENGEAEMLSIVSGDDIIGVVKETK